jgi:arylsulfatase A-like enzyme
MIYDPRAKKHHDISDMVLNIDVPKTILDLAGIKAPREYQGISLLSYVRSKKPEKVREAILFEHLWQLPQIPSSEGIRTSKWKYFRYRFIKTPEELYDLESDPMETNNLAEDPKYKKVVDQLRNECDAQIAKYTKAKLIPDINPSEKIDMSF